MIHAMSLGMHPLGQSCDRANLNHSPWAGEGGSIYPDSISSGDHHSDPR